MEEKENNGGNELKNRAVTMGGILGLVAAALAFMGNREHGILHRMLYPGYRRRM